MNFKALHGMAGDTVYFDVQLAETANASITHNVDLLRQCVRICQNRRPFEITDAVILPRSVRMIWSLPYGDFAYSTRWHIIKTTFARHLNAKPCQLWQPRFSGYVLRSQADYDQHANLIKMSPVSEGLVDEALDWPWLSAHYRAPKPETDRPKTLSAEQIDVLMAAKLPFWLIPQQDSAACLLEPLPRLNQA
jgi:putative transposase